MSHFLGDGDYIEEQHHHHHQAPNGQPNPIEDVRQSQVFSGYGGYPPPSNLGGPSMPPNMHDGMAPMGHNPNAIATSRSTAEDEDHKALFGDVPEGKARKFILVDDPTRNSARVRVRVTLDTVDINEIPDSYRKSNSVYPRSWFPTHMQSPPPSAYGSRFFEDDESDDDSGRPRRGKIMVPVPMVDGSEGQVAIPRMRKSQRNNEAKLNNLGWRMTWHQSRVFSDRTVFLQRACKQPIFLEVK